MLLLDAVAAFESGEPVAFHHTGEPLALRHPNDVNGVARREDVGADLLAGRVRRGVVGPQLDEVPERFPPGLVEMPLRGSVDVARAHLTVRELHRVVPVGPLASNLGDDARTRLDHRHRNGARLDEDLGHPHLLADDPFDVTHRQPQSLISMSTPADRFSRCSSWTVFDVASTMSISRLCVSIWKCSRESLYLCGDRMTV